jgi:hypothetical protein
VKTLAKPHPGGLWNQTSPGTWALDPSSSLGYWESIGANSFVSSTYFDLAGMSMDDKTLFFEAAGTQSALAPTGTPAGAAPGDAMVIADLMTTSPLTGLEALQATIYGNFPPTPLSFQETVYGRVDQWVVGTDTGVWGSYTLMNSEQIGSMMPTASDRIYSYRVVVFATSATETIITITNARHLLKAVAKEEPDHEYMMRLLRSYQLQQEPDVD